MRSIRHLYLALLAVPACSAVWAQDDLWTRATLLDAPGGPKQELAAPHWPAASVQLALCAQRLVSQL